MDFENLNQEDCSAVQMAISIEESWIDQFLANQLKEIAINEQYTLTNITVDIEDELLHLHADLAEKEGTSIDVSLRPNWDPDDQRIEIEDLEFHTNTKNILLKSAGWFAQNFLGGKLDRKLEEQANAMLVAQVEKLKSKPLEIPIPQGGKARVMITGVRVHSLDFRMGGMDIKVTIDSVLLVSLSA